MRHVEKLSAKNVLTSKEGDALAVKTMEKVGDILGSYTCHVCMCNRSEAIVIGGGVSKAGKPLTDCIREVLSEICIPILQEYTDHSCKPWK